MIEPQIGNYRPFPTISEWIEGPQLVTERINMLDPLVRGLEELPKEICQRAIAVVRDAAAIETGAIEDLYQLDSGITVTAATEGALLSSALDSQPERVRALIAAQLSAYDFVQMIGLKPVSLRPAAETLTLRRSAAAWAPPPVSIPAIDA
jgi:hypothetical protein